MPFDDKEFVLTKSTAVTVRQVGRHDYTVASPGFVVRRGKLEITSWGTHGGLQGRVQQLLDD